MIDREQDQAAAAQDLWGPCCCHRGVPVLQGVLVPPGMLSLPGLRGKVEINGWIDDG